MKKTLITLSVFFLFGCSDNHIKVSLIKECSIDAPAESAKLSTKSDFTVGGWIFDKPAHRQLKNLKAQFLSTDQQQVFFLDLPTGGKRPDVAVAFKDNAAESSGYTASLKALSLKPGLYELTVIADVQGVTIACLDTKKIEIIE